MVELSKLPTHPIFDNTYLCNKKTSTYDNLANTKLNFFSTQQQKNIFFKLKLNINTVKAY